MWESATFIGEARWYYVRCPTDGAGYQVVIGILTKSKDESAGWHVYSVGDIRLVGDALIATLPPMPLDEAQDAAKLLIEIWRNNHDN